VVFLRSFPERKRERWGEEEIVAARGRRMRGGARVSHAMETA
jgi:hypothetical protein